MSRSLRRFVQLRWPSRVAVAICALSGVLLPAAFGAVAGVPEPLLHDEYSYLLAADTFAHGRLTNVTPVLPEFFETEHVLLSPSYQSKYPPGQALFLALGQRLVGQPIWGVWISCGLFAGCLCWMLQAWVSRRWSLAVTLIMIATLGTSTYWAQSYWGGMVAASGGALLFGGVRRTLVSPRVTTSALLAAGLVVMAHSRPFEGLLASLPAAFLLSKWLVRDRARAWAQKLGRVVLPAAVILALGAAGMARYNQAVTGSYTQIPYALHQRQYFHQGIFLFSGMRPPERQPVQRVANFYLDWVWPPSRGTDLLVDTVKNLGARVSLSLMVPFGFVNEPVTTGHPYRGVTLWLLLVLAVFRPVSRRIFLLAVIAAVLVECLVWGLVPLYPYPLLPLLAAAWLVAVDRGLRGYPWAPFIGITLLIVGVGQALVALWYPHYFAPLVPLVLAGAAACLQRTSRRSPAGASRTIGWVVIVLLVAQLGTLAVLYGTARRTTPPRVNLRTHEDVKRTLEARAGSDLVFVHYDPNYSLHREWVYNAADIPNAPIIFAHDLGPRNPELIAAYPGRQVWLLTVAPGNAQLSPYPR